MTLSIGSIQQSRVVNIAQVGEYRPPQLASVIFPLPSQSLHLMGQILRSGRIGCATTGKPVPLQVWHVCSLIFSIIVSLSSRLSEAGQQVADSHSGPIGALNKQDIAKLHFRFHGVTAERYPMRSAGIATE
jgi:hypothetical protein